MAKERAEVVSELRSLVDTHASGSQPIAEAPVQPRARRRLWLCVGGLVSAAASLIGVLVLLLHVTWLPCFYALYLTLSVAIGAVCWTNLVWMVHAWRSPAAFDETRQTSADLDPQFSFSLIVPARHEHLVLEATLNRIVQSDHPAFEVLVVVSTDDPLTREVADRVAANHPEVRVVLDTSWPKNKPKAMNSALPHCRGDVVGVFDAEDDVHPSLLRRVDQCFQKTDSDVVQAGVQLTNLHSSWFAVRNVLEYYFWFRSRLHFHARAGFIPLGGNTVFVRTTVLRAAGGWDADCLAEDCELGVRLSSFGAKTSVFYEPELVTREETPASVRAFLRQRTRWNQGYLQTLSRRHWQRLPFKQRALGVYTLAMPYLMALAWVAIPAAIATAIFVKAPVPITLISFLPALPVVAVLCVEAAGLGEVCRTYGERPTIGDYARLVIGLPVYQALLAFAAVRASVREARGVRGWDKTAHFGLHREPTHNGHSNGTSIAPARPAAWKQNAWRPVATVNASPAPIRPLSAISAKTSTIAGDNGHGVQAPRLVEFAKDSAHDGGSVTRYTKLDDVVPDVNGERPLWLRLNGSSPEVPPTATATANADVSRNPARRRLLHIDTAVQLVLLAFVGVVQFTNDAHFPAVAFDEGTYVSYGWAVQTHGALSNYTYGYGHPPLGWLGLTLWTWVSGLFVHTIPSIVVGREFTGAVTLITCSLLYTFARRVGISRPFAVAAVLLFGLSPIGLHFHRLVLIDNPSMMWMVAALVLAVSPRQRLWTFAASGACFAAAVLSKETTLVLLPVVFVAAWPNFDRRTRRYSLTFLTAFFFLAMLFYPLYATLKGELIPGPGHVSLLDEAFFQVGGRAGTGSLFDSHSGTYLIVQWWLGMDPWLVGAGLFLAPLALARRATRAAAVACVILFAMVLRPGYLPSMFVIAFLPFAALVIAGTADGLWKYVRHGSERSRAQSDGSQGTQLARASSDARKARKRVMRGAAAALGFVVVVECGLVIAPRWARADQQAMTEHMDIADRAAQQWLVRNVDHSKRLLVSDDFWIYLVTHGFNAQPEPGGFYSRTVVFYWPFDFDPAVHRLFPNGWKDIDYIVSESGMRNDVATRQVPETALAVAHSRLVVSFGQGPDRVEIRAIDHESTTTAAKPARRSSSKRHS